MKKFADHIYIIIFLALCIVPCFGMIFFYSESSAEKRTLAEFPDLFTEGTINTEYPTQFEEYISDHFFLREELGTANSLMMGYLFQTSAEDSVIVGKDNWLFYQSTEDDYLNQNTLSERGIQRVAITLELMGKYLEANDTDFIVTIAPNKNTIYPEMMPVFLQPTDNADNLERLSTILLSDQSVNYVDLETVLTEQKNSGVLNYHKWDSHWNNFGALAAYRAIIKEYSSLTGDDMIAYDAYDNTAYETK